MKKIIKNIICITVLFFLLVPFAVAESEYVDAWLGTWTVKMKDKSVVTWELTDTWVSKTGMSHIVYGKANPGNVEFLIFYSGMFFNYNYIEVPNGTTVYDLPQDFSKYTELVPSDDFKTFTAKDGAYPIISGFKGTVEPKPQPCAASYLLGADDPRLYILRQFRDRELAASTAGENLIRIYYDKSADIIAVCEKNPAAKQSLKQLLESIIPAVSRRCNKSANN